MATYTIKGPTTLKGSIRVGGAKNASLKLMVASLLAETPSTLLNFSHISDVEVVAKSITSLGGTAQPYGERAYIIDPRNLSSSTLDKKYGKATRISSMLLVPLLSKFGKASVPLPGGDDIGARPLERHLDGLRAMGATITTKDGMLHAQAQQLVGADYTFAKNTHTGTETLLIAAATAQGTTTLRNAAEETEVDDLIDFINRMGGNIKRTQARTIVIEGVPKLKGTQHKIMPDQNQVVSFACAALATKGDVIVENTRKEDLQAFLEALDQAGAGYDIGSFGIRFYYKQPLKATDVVTKYHPGFKTDWQPLWVTLMTQAQGTSTVHETVTQSRFQYVPALQEMGAKIELYNPEVTNPDEVYNFNLDVVDATDRHAAKITGPTSFKPGSFTIKDLRHGATLLIAGMMSAGTTVLHDPDHHIDRGYENLDQAFSQLGAQITKS